MSEYIYDWTPNKQHRKEEIVRCRDCKYYFDSTVDEDGDGEPSWCMYWKHEWLRDDGFCAWGEKVVGR